MKKLDFTMKIRCYFRMSNFSIDDFLGNSSLSSLPCQLQIALTSEKNENDSINCTDLSHGSSHKGLAWLTSVLFVFVFPIANLFITGKSGWFNVAELSVCIKKPVTDSSFNELWRTIDMKTSKRLWQKTSIIE